MLSLSGQFKVFLAARPTDMRKSFDTLAALVQEVLRLDPLSGHLFVFRGKRADRVKILWWDTHGCAIWYKQLQVGTFALPSHDGESLSLTSAQLALLLSGIDLSQTRPRKRYHHAG
jgi:transposase